MKSELLTKNKILKIIFKVWWSFGKLLGLFPFTFNEEEEKFVPSKSHKCYTIFIGIFTTLGYPFAVKRFYAAVVVIEIGANSTAERVSTLGDIFWYLFIATVYFYHGYFTNQILDFANAILRYDKLIKNNYKDQHKTSKRIQWTFTFFIILKLVKFIQNISAIPFLVDANKLIFLDYILFIFPDILKTVLFSIHFLGVLFFELHITKLKFVADELLKSDEIISDGNLRSDFIDSSIYMDEIAMTYNLLQMTLMKFERFYGFMMLFMLFDYFEMMVQMVYYDLIWSVELSLSLEQRVSTALAILGFIIITLLLIDILVYFNACSNCYYQVRQIQIIIFHYNLKSNKFKFLSDEKAPRKFMQFQSL